MPRLLGAHMSIAGGLDKAIERGLSIDCTAMQIFVKNSNQWFSSPLEETVVNSFLAQQKASQLFVFAHTGYLINLASPKPANHEKSLASLQNELERAEALRLPFIVMHPGSHMGEGEESGLNKVVKSLDEIFSKAKDYQVKIALESTAGQGTNLGYKFDQLGYIINKCKFPERLGVCFDTCHSFAAGYDLRTPETYKETWEQFNSLIGLNNLLAIHLNDSKGDCGSRKDRHELLGEGKLGLGAFKLLMGDQRLKNIPMVLETPKSEDLHEDAEALSLLKKLAQ